MKTYKIIALTLLFNFIFWQEQLALNWLLFVLISSLFAFQDVIKLLASTRGKVVFASVLLSATMLVIQHSVVSLIASLISYCVFIGFLNFPEFRTIFNAFVTGLSNWDKFPGIQRSSKSREKANPKRRYRRMLSIVFPASVVLLFFIIFYGANSVFRGAINYGFDQIGNFFQYILPNISLGQVFFLIPAFLISTWTLTRGNNNFLFNHEATLSDFLFRRKNNTLINPMYAQMGKKPKYEFISTMALKLENTISLYAIRAVCALLFIINCIDIVYVWFGFGYTASTNYSSEVHEGVYLLIISVLLSIAIMLYFFRNSQNFYHLSRRLRLWSTIWIVQNVVLIISVIFRNYYYIHTSGLTHKRIGVFVFLVIVLIGLYSLWVKIQAKKSFFYMAKFNSWSIYGVLIFLSFFNWDMLICKHNLQTISSKDIDIAYLATLSDDVIIELKQNYEAVEAESAHNPRTQPWALQIINRRFDQISTRMHKTQHIWSWNYREHRMKEKLKTRHQAWKQRSH